MNPQQERQIKQNIAKWQISITQHTARLDDFDQALQVVLAQFEQSLQAWFQQQDENQSKERALINLDHRRNELNAKRSVLIETAGKNLALLQSGDEKAKLSEMLADMGQVEASLLQRALDQQTQLMPLFEELEAVLDDLKTSVIG